MTRRIPVKTLFTITAYAIAMGYLEAVIVIYLRDMFYPGGFDFPLIILPVRVVLIEYLRELATLVMLGTVGYLAGKNFSSRFGWFLFAFGVWDIFYYLFLKWALGWPDSLLTWDILFLIPIVWAAPVLAPVISAVTMILYGVVLNLFQGYRYSSRLSRNEWIFLLSGAFIVFITFIRDYTRLVIHYYSHRTERGMGPQDLQNAITHYIPQHFSWIPFFAGEILILISLFLWIIRVRHQRKNP